MREIPGSRTYEARGFDFDCNSNFQSPGKAHDCSQNYE